MCPKYDRRCTKHINPRAQKMKRSMKRIPPSTRRQDTGTDGNEANEATKVKGIYLERNQIISLKI